MLLESIQRCLHCSLVLKLVFSQVCVLLLLLLLLSFLHGSFLPHLTDLLHELFLLLLIGFECNVDVELTLFFLSLQVLLDYLLGQRLSPLSVQCFFNLMPGLILVHQLLGLLDSL